MAYYGEITGVRRLDVRSIAVEYAIYDDSNGKNSLVDTGNVVIVPSGNELKEDIDAMVGDAIANIIKQIEAANALIDQLRPFIVGKRKTVADLKRVQQSPNQVN